MGSGKKSQHKSNPHFRARTTRSSKGRLLTDPSQTTQELTTQLRSLGLYAAPTLGDGNCLFRALSDQYYGSPSRHLEVRRDVCDWIEQHKERYEGFVDEDEFGSGGGKTKVDAYLRRMRENATYGGHMELSAFAHLTRRNIKVIQPGIVYIIQCDPSSSSESKMDVDDDGSDDEDEDEMSSKDKRKKRRDRMKAAKQAVEDAEEGASDGPTIYVAYHDWEHFSSIRNQKGPHTGLPNIQETGSSAPAKAKSPPATHGHAKKVQRVKLKLSQPTPSASSPEPSTSKKSPFEIPLPPSRSLSPAPTHTAPASAIRLSPPRSHRSPKRSFDESSEASGSSSSKRSRVDSSPSPSKRQKPDDSDSESDEEEETPSLSPSSIASASTSSLSSLSPSPEPEPVPVPLTKRERKKLGLPRQRVVGGRGGAGKIVIPGGRFRGNGGTVAVKEEEEEVVMSEWRTNGSGRVDVRGFRELKI